MGSYILFGLLLNIFFFMACNDEGSDGDFGDICSTSVSDKVASCSSGPSSSVPSVMENVIPPVIETTTLTLTKNTSGSFTLGWESAKDELDPQELLQYTVYYSEQSNLNTISEMEMNGTVFDSHMRNTNSVEVTDLDDSKIYYFNIVVSDLNDNKSAYNMISSDQSTEGTDSGSGSSSPLDSDGDGIPDSEDQCNGSDDALIGIRYKDADNDGLVVVSSSSTLCPDDPTYTIAASEVTSDQLNYIDDDDSTAETDFQANTTNEQELGFDFDNNTILNETYNIYVISNANQWLNYASSCSFGANFGCFYDAMIIADLDFAEFDGTSTDKTHGDGRYTCNSAYRVLAGGITSSTYYFRSVVDGRNNKFINFDIDLSAEVGLNKGCGINTVCNNVGAIVGVCYGCEVRNLSFTGSVIGGSKVGGIIGYVNLQTNLSALTFSGTISATGDKVGGILGETFGSVILNGGKVSGSIASTSGNSVGGIVGYGYRGVQIKKSSNTASVTSTGDEIGGIIGHMSDDPGEDSAVTESYNTGAVTGSSMVGGVAGEVRDGSTVTDNYNLGTVTSSLSHTGGVVGYLTVGTAHRNYNAGQVLNNNSNSGEGVIGFISSSTSNNNYYLTGTTDSDGDGDVDGGDSDTDNGSPTATATSIANFKKEATFTNFNFGTCSNSSYTTKSSCEANSATWTQIWEISQDNSYPYLFGNEQTPAPGN